MVGSVGDGSAAGGDRWMVGLVSGDGGSKIYNYW